MRSGTPEGVSRRRAHYSSVISGRWEMRPPGVPICGGMPVRAKFPSSPGTTFSSHSLGTWTDSCPSAGVRPKVQKKP